MDPFLDVAPAVPDVLANSKTGRTFSGVSPRVQRGDWNAQVVGKLLGSEQAVKCLHHRIVSNRPVIRVLSGCKRGC